MDLCPKVEFYSTFDESALKPGAKMPCPDILVGGAFHLNSTRVATHVLRIDSLFYQLMGLMKYELMQNMGPLS